MMKPSKLLVAIALTAVLLTGSLVGYYKMLASSEDANVTYIPAEMSDVLNNPYMGFAVDARFGSSVEQPYRLAHANLYWRDLEPVEGQYDWEAIEEAYQFDVWREKKVNLILRVVMDYPTDSSHMDIPEWLYESIGRQGTWYNNDYGQGFSPDYDHPVLIAKHGQLIQALAERYNDDPLIAYIQLGSLGHWGEWHTRDEDPGRIEFPKRAVSDQYAMHYIRHFTNKPLVMRRPHAVALEHKMGLYNDAFGKRESTIEGFLDWYTNGYTSWLTQEPEPAMPDFWTYAPSGGEFSDAKRYVTDAYIEDTLLQAKLTHVTWMGPSAPTKEPLGSKLQPNIDRFLNTIGYRYVIAKESHEEKVRPGGKLHVRATVINRGVAPIYYRWPLEIGIADAEGVLQSNVRSSQDIRTWLPGTHQVSVDVPIPAAMPAGEYTLTAAILDPSSGQPGIDLAIEGRRPDGRYTLGSFTVSR